MVIRDDTEWPVTQSAASERAFRGDWSAFHECAGCSAAAGEACWSLSGRRGIAAEARSKPRSRKTRPCANRTWRTE